MPTDPNRPDGSEADSTEKPVKKELAPIVSNEGEGTSASLEEERLVRVFEQLLVRHEEVETGSSLSPEQITLALRQQEEDRKRSHERMMLREAQRHEIALARQREEAERWKQQLEFRKSRRTFLPSLVFLFGFLAIAGTAIILYILVSNGAKDQIGTVLAFLSGLVGGILTGFGGGFATAKLLRTGSTEQDKKK